MKIISGFRRFVLITGFAGLIGGQALAAGLVVPDPALNPGASAINKSGRVLVAAAGSTSEETLESLTNFSGIASFPFAGNISVTNEYVFDFTTGTGVPDLRLRYIGPASQYANTSVALVNATYSTSVSDAMRLGIGGIDRTFIMRIDAGTYAGGAFAADQGLTALGFTLTIGSNALEMPINIKYYDSAGDLLSAQTVTNLISTTSYRYTGYQSSGEAIAYAEIIYSTTGLAAAPVVTLDDLSFSAASSRTLKLILISAK